MSEHLSLADLTGPNAPATITVEQLSEFLGVSRAVAYEAARTGELPTLRLGRRVLVPVPRLLALLGVEPSAMRDDGEKRASTDSGLAPSAIRIIC